MWLNTSVHVAYIPVAATNHSNHLKVDLERPWILVVAGLLIL